MRILFKYLILALLFPALASAWELQLNEDNIKVYTKDIKDSNFKAFRGEVEVDSSLINVVAHHVDLEAMTEWLHDCSESKLVRKVDAHDFYVYQRTSAPWPVSDRDYVIHMNISQNTSDYSVLMTFEAEIQASENNEDCVPVTQLKGYWRFTPKSLNRVLIEYETSADPAGDLPAWLANSFVVDQPYGTLKKLKQRVENNSYTLPEEMAFIKAKASD